MAQKAKEKAEKSESSYLEKFISKLVVSVTLLPLIMWLWPGVVPFGFWEFWKIRGTPAEWLRCAWPFFAWGSGLTLIAALVSTNERETNRFAERILTTGAAVSTWAGTVEEITFRWLFFLTTIMSVQFGNWLFFGWAGWGCAEFLHLNAFGPLADLVTLGYLKPYLFHSSGWAVGAGMLGANSFFRDGHKYQGWFGTINSWFIGMFLFWVMFTYGLVPAILIHFTYDFLIFSVRYLDAVLERARGIV